MNIYNAIMKAADHIEMKPYLYDFMHTTVPDCGTPGCMLGWIGHFAGVPVGSDVLDTVAQPLLGIYYEVHMAHPFYMRLRELGAGRYWTDAAVAAAAMRLYAEKYHSPKKGRHASKLERDRKEPRVDEQGYLRGAAVVAPVQTYERTL